MPFKKFIIATGNINVSLERLVFYVDDHQVFTSSPILSKNKPGKMFQFLPKILS